MLQQQPNQQHPLPPPSLLLIVPGSCCDFDFDFRVGDRMRRTSFVDVYGESASSMKDRRRRSDHHRTSTKTGSSFVLPPLLRLRPVRRESTDLDLDLDFDLDLDRDALSSFLALCFS